MTGRDSELEQAQDSQKQGRASLFSFFRRKPRLPKLTGHVINMWEHKTWGDNLFWWSYPGDRQGHSSWTLGTHARRIPRVGDEVRSQMQSGRIGRWIVTEVDYMRGVSDGFFAPCVPLEPFYVDELAAA